MREILVIYLFTGVFEAATIHYAVAKIFGPLVFGRGSCGYACWTAMVLDFLPYKIPQTSRNKKWEKLRYVTFGISLIFVASRFLLQVGHLERIMFWSFGDRKYSLLRNRNYTCISFQG